MPRKLHYELTQKLKEKFPTGEAGYSFELYEDGEETIDNWYVRTEAKEINTETTFPSKPDAETYINALPPFPSSKNMFPSK